MNIKLYLLIVISVVTLIGCKGKNEGDSKGREVPPAMSNMVLVQAGDFLMGTDEMKVNTADAPFLSARTEGEDAKPMRKVYAKEFYIDKYEVTYAEFRKFSPEFQYPEGVANHPVIYVTWYQADDYCKSLGKRLPEEFEWEKAARGIDGRTYPWGNDFDANKASFGNKILPVGSVNTDVSVYGAFDMAGNVSEWTASWYKPYEGSQHKSSDFGEAYKVSRGGSYNDTGHYFLPIFSQVVFRYYNPPDEGGMDNGFRCAK